jgi:hypothetical protein
MTLALLTVVQFPLRDTGSKILSAPTVQILLKGEKIDSIVIPRSEHNMAYNNYILYVENKKVQKTNLTRKQILDSTSNLLDFLYALCLAGDYSLENHHIPLKII